MSMVKAMNKSEVYNYHQSQDCSLLLFTISNTKGLRNVGA